MITPTKLLHVRTHTAIEGVSKIELKVSVAKGEHTSGSWGDMRITSSQHNGQRSAIVEIDRQQIGQVYLNDGVLGETGPFYQVELKFSFYNIESLNNFREALEAVFGETIDLTQILVDSSNFVKHSPLATMSGIPATATRSPFNHPLENGGVVPGEVARDGEAIVRSSGRMGSGVNCHMAYTKMRYGITVHDEFGLCLASVTDEVGFYLQPITFCFDLGLGAVYITHPLFEGHAAKMERGDQFTSPTVTLVNDINSLLPKNLRLSQKWDTALVEAQLTILVNKAYAKIKDDLVSSHASLDKYVLRNNRPFGEYLERAVSVGGESVFFEANDEGTVWSVYLGKQHLADIKEGEVGLNIDILTGDEHLTLRGQIEQLFRSMDLKFA